MLADEEGFTHSPPAINSHKFGLVRLQDFIQFFFFYFPANDICCHGNAFFRRNDDKFTRFLQLSVRITREMFELIFDFSKNKRNKSVTDLVILSLTVGPGNIGKTPQSRPIRGKTSPKSTIGYLQNLLAYHRLPWKMLPRNTDASARPIWCFSKSPAAPLARPRPCPCPRRVFGKNRLPGPSPPRR